ncbi:MAG: CinA family nicotinamide mononucleotide deamidase-related protein [Chitinophagaceae bacterium]
MPKAVEASIITIGDELLIGQVIDTNSAWMAAELNEAGIRVKRRVAVADVWDEIWYALDEESKNADIILITGGLGPTADDITKPLLCKYFDGKMVVNEGAEKNVRNIFEVILKRPMIARNLKQAEVPDTCTVIQNTRGTAPGMWFEKNSKVYVSMPGVPHEMKGMMELDVLKALQKKFVLPVIIHKTLLTAGVGESILADMLLNFESTLPPEVKLAYLPNYGMVRLRLTSSGFDKEKVTTEIGQLFERLQELVNEHLVTNVDESMQEVVAKLLLKNKQSLVTAESCTGGYIAHLLSANPGSSAFYKGSIVAYDYDVKEKLLHVPPDILLKFGAVSQETVLCMLDGVLNATGSDFGIAVSGIMGPAGGTDDKPVGTVWIAVGNKIDNNVLKMHFRFDRSRNIELTATNALNLLRKFIIQTTINPAQ